MDCESLKKNLANLEQSIRHYSKGSNWILLEPIDPELLSKLSYLNEYSFEASAPSVSLSKKLLSKDGFQPVHPPAYTLNASEKLKPPVALSTTPPKFDHSPTDLDPLTATNLDSLRLRLRECARCKLCENRSTVVFGQGNQKAEIVLIGEGPGEEEDRTGLAFVGKAGKLLTQMIHSIGINRDAVYICNIVKCRPPGNRNPEIDEVEACFPFLKMQLEFIKPKLIVTLGNVATKTLIPGAQGIVKMRGRIIDYQGITLIPTFHPSYLLRNLAALSDVWNDMRKIRQVLFSQHVSRNT